MSTETLIAAEELAALLAEADPLLIDCRKELDAPQRGREAYAAEHLPGALYADLDTDLSDLSKTGLGRHPLPDEAAFSAVLSAWGWHPQRVVVAYDDAGGALAAARLWWMLRIVGARSVRVLDGGFSAWRDRGLATTSAEPAPKPGNVSVRFDASQPVGVEALQAGLVDASLRLLDARAAPRYRGEVEPLDRVAGHVPGALNRPFADNLDAHGHFKPPARLAAEFAPLIAPYPPHAVVHMCGSGVTACHNLLAMEHAGLSGSRLFAPSWSGWLADPARPVETGSGPDSAGRTGN
jgi:thiosulfate/3-mercaptopyruvate sulfurtransferase